MARSAAIEVAAALIVDDTGRLLGRMASLAISEIQTGQMWAVKAATWKF